jgi:hypothetical protein
MGHLVSQMKMNPVAEDGFLQRFQLAVIYEQSGPSKYVDKRHDPTSELVLEKNTLRIHSWIRGIVEKVELNFIYADYDDEAQELYPLLHTKINEISDQYADNRYMQSHVLKYPKLLNALALIFEVLDCAREDSEVPPCVVKKSSLEMAWEWIKVLMVHAEQLYKLDEIHNLGGVSELLKRIKSRDVKHGMTLREIKRKNWAFLKKEADLQDAIIALTDLGWCKIITTKKERGAPSKIIHLHPLLRDSNE